MIKTKYYKLLLSYIMNAYYVHLIIGGAEKCDPYPLALPSGEGNLAN